jgi:hypothetical protein
MKEKEGKDKPNTEDRKAQLLRYIVDFTISLIYQSGDGIENDFRLVDAVREKTVKFFPGKEKTFFLIYYPRFRRVLVEKYGLKAEYYDHQLNKKFEEYFGGAKDDKVN